MASFRRISPPTIMSKPRKLNSNIFFIWGKSHHSITNSSQLVTAAIWYSGLWFSRNESVDNLSGLYFATMTYSEKWKNERDTKYQPKYFHFVSPKLKRRAIPKTLPNENKKNIIIYLCVVDQATLLGATCCAPLTTLLRRLAAYVGQSLKMVKFERLGIQHVETRQPWEISNVALVVLNCWDGLAGA